MPSKPEPQTVRLRNINPIGAVDIPALGLSVDAGAEFDVPSEVAAVLLEQTGNYEKVS